MHRFALKRLEEFEGLQTFDKLVINDKCQFDDFVERVIKNKTYESEIGKKYRCMERLSNRLSLPNTSFKDITPKNERIKEYEFRSRNLRVYAMKRKNGKIVVFGGFKKDQNKDIMKFRATKKKYVESLDN